VQKVYESINRSALPVSVARAIPIQVSHTTRAQLMTPEQYLVRMRSSAFDNVAAAAVANVAQAIMPSAQAPAQTAAPAEQAGPQPTPPIGTTAALALAANQAMTPSSSGDIFEPQVRGPNDPVFLPKEDAPPAQVAGDHADLRQGGHDDAFVF
jgi:type IV secretion system protein VirB1